MDREYMRLAIEEAVAAERAGNRPFGAVLVREGEVIGCGHNRCVSDCDPTAHGETIAIRDTCRALGTLTLDRATLYTTAEPCLLCTGAITYARIARVVIGAVCGRPRLLRPSREGLVAPGGAASDASIHGYDRSPA